MDGQQPRTGRYSQGGSHGPIRFGTRASRGSRHGAGRLPRSALAAQPIEQFHDHFTDSFSAEICGIAVDVDVVVTDNFFLYADGTFKDTSSFKQTFTNPENGQSVVAFIRGQVTGPPPVVDEEAGTITFLTSYKGLPREDPDSTGGRLAP